MKSFLYLVVKTAIFAAVHINPWLLLMAWGLSIVVNLTDIEEHWDLFADRALSSPVFAVVSVIFPWCFVETLAKQLGSVDTDW